MITDFVNEMQFTIVKAVAQTEASFEMMIKQRCFEALQVTNNTTIVAVFVSLSLA